MDHGSASLDNGAANTPRGGISAGRRVLVYTVFIGLIAALYTRGDDAVDALYERAEARIKRWQELEVMLHQPGTGLDGVDPLVLSLVDLLKMYGAQSFRMTLLARDFGGGHLLQRTSEVAWPLPYADDAKFVVRLRQEEATCALVVTLGEIALDRCG
jgi:hypothetical protein